MINSYTIRVVLSIAITEMVPPVDTAAYNNSDLCSADEVHKFTREVKIILLTVKDSFYFSIVN